MKKKKAFAVFSMLVLMVVGTYLGSARSLKKIVGEANDVFYQGEFRDGLSIQHDLDERISLAFNMITVANKYDSDSREVQNVMAARNALLSASTIADKYDANVMLTEATTILYEAMIHYDLSQKDAEYRKRIHTDLKSRNATISHDRYNEVAMAANKKLKEFPASVLGKLVRVANIEEFQ